MTLDFLDEATNVVLAGPNGVGKSTLAQNIADQALIACHTVLFVSAGQLLGDLCALDSDAALRRGLRYYARPKPLVIDELGYLSYSTAAQLNRPSPFSFVSRSALSRTLTPRRPSMGPRERLQEANKLILRYPWKPENWLL